MKVKVIWCSALLLAGSACVGEGYVLDWGLHEQRLLVPKGQREPPRGEWQFQVAVPIGVDRERLALAAEQSLSVGDNASITEPEGKEFATVFGLRDVSIGKAARVGSVYGGSTAPLVIRDGAIVDGFVRANSDIAPTTAHFGLGLLTNIRDPGEYFRWTVSPPGEPSEVHVPPRTGARMLPPGAYARVSVGAGSELVLGGGQYFFQTLDVGDGTLRIEDTAVAVYVWVRDELRLAGAPRCAEGSRFLLGYHGGGSMSVPPGFCGTLVAPFATLRLGGAQPYTGAFFARSIEVAPGVVLQHRPFRLST